jgi:hypothetical protein
VPRIPRSLPLPFVQIEPTGPLVTTSDGAVVYESARARALLADGYRVELDLEVERGGIVVNSVAITRIRETTFRSIQEGAPLTRQTLRDLDLNVVRDEVVAHMVEQAMYRTTLRWPDQNEARERATDVTSRRRRLDDPTFLSEVAAVYKQHIDDAPTEAVAEHFHGSPRSAARWVSAAAELGFLPQTGRGRVRRLEGDG